MCLEKKLYYVKTRVKKRLPATREGRTILKQKGGGRTKRGKENRQGEKPKTVCERVSNLLGQQKGNPLTAACAAQGEGKKGTGV